MNDLYPKTSQRPNVQGGGHEKLVKIGVAAEYLSVSTSWLYERGDRHGIPCHRLGNQRRYRLSELAAATGGAA